VEGTCCCSGGIMMEGGCSVLGTCGSMLVSSCVIIGRDATLGGVVVVGACTPGGSTTIGTFGGLTVSTGTLGGATILGKVSGVVMRWNMFANLLTAAIVSLEMTCNVAGGGGLCRTLVRFVVVIMMGYVWVSAGVLHFIRKKSTVYVICSLPVSVMLLYQHPMLHVVSVFRRQQFVFLVVPMGWC
jgi:hypothetical protein